MLRGFRLTAGLVAAGATAFVLAGAVPADAAARARTVYVSPRGGTLIVCRGRYRAQAVITKSLALIGRHAVINAQGQHYGIYLNGRIHAAIRQNRFHRVRVHIKVA